jgi:ribosome-associated translation inhibitor RaiA
MELVLHSHNATVSDVIRDRAERLVERLAPRFGRIVDATVRFKEDGPLRCVEIEFHAAGGRRIVSEGTGRYFGPALGHAGARLRAQLDHGKRTRRERSRDATAAPLANAS